VEFEEAAMRATFSGGKHRALELRLLTHEALWSMLYPSYGEPATPEELGRARTHRLDPLLLVHSNACFSYCFAE
jgi:hypothetical protein